MTAYDHVRLATAISSLTAPAANTTARGRRLQDLVEWLFGEIPQCSVRDRNTVNVGGSQEKDLWISHNPGHSGLSMLEPLFPIECKNKVAKASAAEVREFGSKIRASGGRDGVLIAREGLSGTSSTHGHQEVRDQLGHDTRIVLLSGNDLTGLGGTDDLVNLVQDRFEELRLNQTYISI